ncbi:MAG: sugar phosphate isomerase/epimerase [Pirellulales bacterium]|nr:sugar phosphate isomerase/epimerase [Pirellulales bacterium]
MAGTRREFIKASGILGLGTLAGYGSTALANDKPKEKRESNKSKIGLASYSYHLMITDRVKKGISKAETIAWILDKVKDLHLDGVQIGYSELDEAVVKSFIDREGVYLELAMGTWNKKSLTKRMEIAVRMGARSLRAFLIFDPLAWKRYDKEKPSLMKKLEEAAAIAEHFKVPLAIENHSDYAAWQIAELVGNIKSKYLGICFDSGNPPSSYEDPVEAAKVVAPYTIQTHLRDFKIVHTDYGLRYEGVPLGDGIVDAPEIVRILKNNGPVEVLSIESAVRANPSKSVEENLRYEDEGVYRSIEYARTKLGL